MRIRCLVAGVLLSWSGLAKAAIPLPVTLEELSRKADTIVIGTVRGQESRFNDDGSLILTHTTVDVSETLAGTAGPVVTVSEYGGRVGEVALTVSGLPRFEDGDRVLLFLCRDALELPRTCGATQGRFRIRTMPDGSLRASGRPAGEAIDETVDELRRRVAATRAEEHR